MSKELIGVMVQNETRCTTGRADLARRRRFGLNGAQRLPMKFSRCLLWLSLVVVLCVWLPTGAAAEEGPRLGKYRILSYGATSIPPLFLGSVVLEAGKYTFFLPGDKPAGEGRYEYDAAAKKVKWLSGPFLDKWGGDFTIDREGKTHKIRLKSTTIATNSTD
nr:Unknown Function [uncultured bacterium]